MLLFVAKMVFFLLSGSKKLPGESVRGRVIRSNMRLHIRRTKQLTRSFPANLNSMLYIAYSLGFLPFYGSVLLSVTALDDKQRILNHGALPRLGQRLSSGSYRRILLLHKKSHSRLTNVSSELLAHSIAAETRKESRLHGFYFERSVRNVYVKIPQRVKIAVSTIAYTLSPRIK